MKKEGRSGTAGEKIAGGSDSPDPWRRGKLGRQRTGWRDGVEGRESENDGGRRRRSVNSGRGLVG